MNLTQKNGAAAPHAGHRERLRTRLLTAGDRGLFDHELVELLLFYAVRRVNVNPLAHRLLAACPMKSLTDPAVSLPAAAELCTAATGENVAGALALLGEFAEAYHVDKNDAFRGRRSLNDVETAMQCAEGLFAGAETEGCFLLCLDNRMSLKNCVRLSFARFDDGGDASFAEIYRPAVICGSVNLLLAGCHTDGCPAFSEAEFTTGRRLCENFAAAGIRLVDFLLCCDGSAVSLRRSGLLQEEAAR